MLGQTDIGKTEQKLSYIKPPSQHLVNIVQEEDLPQGSKDSDKGQWQLEGKDTIKRSYLEG